MRSSDLEECIKKLRNKFTLKTENLYEETFLRLDADFPNDVGCISLFFLNLVHLMPGEAINLEANLPHAYLEGDCVECMACSDNTIRAGLSPKFKDVDALLRMLDYTPKDQDEVKYQARVFDDQQFTRGFIPKVDDFAVLEIKIPPGVEKYVIKNRKFGSILLVLEGHAVLKVNGQSLILDEAKIIFLPADTKQDLELLPKGKFTAYQAMFNDF